MHEITLRYGRSGLRVGLDPDWQPVVIGKRPMPVLDDPEGAVRDAFARPVAAPPLAAAARGRKDACILICDITRPVPNRLFLGPMVRTLMEAGIPAERITLLVATGLHRPNEGDELAEIVGDPWVLETVHVVNHFARNDADHVDLGTSSHGTRVRLDRRFVEADLRIATGLVEPHLMAGWSGGRKVIAPGVAHRDTITSFHSAHYVGHPQARACNLEGNPLHEDQLEIVKLLGEVYALNTVIDEHRRLAFVNYGEIVASHDAAVEFCSRYTIVPMPRRYKTVVTSCAGYPLDKTFYQAAKGMLGAMEIMEPGGTLILASECSEGLGSAEFVAAQRRLVEQGYERFIEEIHRKRHADIDEWSTQLLTIPMQSVSVHLYATGLDAEQRRLTGLTVIDSVEEAIRASVERSGDREIVIIPEGPYVMPVHAPERVAR